MKLERNSAGVWQIDSMAIMPEDIISMQYGGHSPWHSDVQEVAQVAAGAYRQRECGVDTPSPAAPQSSDINWTVTCVDDGSKYAVHEVRLHSGEWHIGFSDAPLDAALFTVPAGYRPALPRLFGGYDPLTPVNARDRSLPLNVKSRFPMHSRREEGDERSENRASRCRVGFPAPAS